MDSQQIGMVIVYFDWKLSSNAQVNVEQSFADGLYRTVKTTRFESFELFVPIERESTPESADKFVLFLTGMLELVSTGNFGIDQLPPSNK